MRPRAFRTGCAAASAAVFAMLCGPAGAQDLRMLHVVALTMSADRTEVPLGSDFHLSVHARVREHVTALDELIVPEVGTMHLLGDERRVHRGPAGTDIDETLTLEPVDAGSFTIPGAFLDAIDARTDKPTRFTANAVHVRIGAQAANTGPERVRRAALALLGILVAAAGVALIVRLASRRGRAAPPAGGASVSPAAVAPLVAASPRQAVRAALGTYAAAPSSDTLAALRRAVLAAAGTAPGGTTRDAVSATSDEALRATEAALFARDDQHSTAKERFIEAARGWAG